MCHRVNIADLPKQSLKIKESENMFKYLDLARDIKKKDAVKVESDGDIICSLSP